MERQERSAHAVPLLDDDLLFSLFAPSTDQRDDAPVAKPPVPESSAGPELDEALLLDETEALLEILLPAAFAGSPRDNVETAPAVSASVSSARSVDATDSGSSAVDSDSSIAMAASPYPLKAKSTRVHNPNRKRTTKPGSMRNPSRERLQDELEYLRKQVLVLETVLESTPTKSTPAAKQPLEVAVTTHKWERIAKRQRAGSERALSENKRLRGMLALQRTLVVGMEETLYNWPYGAVGPSLPTPVMALPAKTRHKTVRLEPGDDVLFAMLVAELDDAYVHVADMFQAAGLDSLPSVPFSQTSFQFKSDGSPNHQRSVVEVVNVDVSPFEFEMMTRVMRIASERLSESTDTVAYDGSWDSEHVFAEKCRLERHLRSGSGSTVDIDLLTAMKEFVFDDRVVVVWRSIFKSDAHFPGCYVHEAGARVTTPLGRSSTVEKSVVHFEPRRFAAPATVVRADSDVLTDLVLSSYRDEVGELEALMDGMLIEEAKHHSPP